MPAFNENFAFIVKTDKSLHDQIPVLSKETFEQYRADIAEYIGPLDEQRNKIISEEFAQEQTASNDELVMYIVINDDLHMSPGKVAAQAGHVVVEYMCSVAGAIRYVEIIRTRKKYYQGEDIIDPKVESEYKRLKNKWFQNDNWIDGGQVKIVLGANQKTIEKLAQLPNVYSIRDEGRTEIPAGSLTAVCFEPMKKSEQPKELKRLQLYK